MLLSFSHSKNCWSKLKHKMYLWHSKPILGQKHLQYLMTRKYVFINNSIVDYFCLKPIEALAMWIPAWVPPNLLTVLGLTALILPSVMICFRSPTATEQVKDIDIQGSKRALCSQAFNRQVPGWILLSASIGYIAFYILDTMDGIHARNTGQSSAVGEILDHGGDVVGESKILINM